MFASLCMNHISVLRVFPQCVVDMVDPLGDASVPGGRFPENNQLILSKNFSHL